MWVLSTAEVRIRHFIRFFDVQILPFCLLDIRSDVPAGTITLGNVLNLLSFSNDAVSSFTATGSVLLDVW